MTNTPYKNSKKEEALTSQRPHSKCCLNSPSSALTVLTSSLYTQKAGGGHSLRLLCSILIILATIAIPSCSSDTGEEETKSSQSEITVTEIPKRATTDVRDSYVLFSISAKEAVSNYLLAVKETSAAAPTPAELTQAGLKRNLDTTPINVLIAQQLNAPMITFANNYFSDNTQQTLGANMLKQFYSVSSQNFGLIYDGNAVGTEAWIKESVLKASTGYTLYGMKEGQNQVDKLQTFVTDAALEVPTTGPELSYADSTLEKDHIEIAINANELYIFPLQAQMNTAQGINAVDLYFSESADGVIVLTTGNIGEAGNFLTEDSKYQNMLYLFKEMGSHVVTYANGGIYVLTDTTRSKDSFYYGLRYNLDVFGSTDRKYYSVLVKQQ